MEATKPATPPPRHVLEDGERLSTSFLWRAQRAYFERTGLAAWAEGVVPEYVTTNPFVATAYARLVMAWLDDVTAAGRLPPASRAYIVELGAGSGRFAHAFLACLTRLLERRPPGAVAVTYVMTDFHDGIIERWRQHPWLRRFVDTGVLDFARFDAGADQTLTLRESGVVIAPAAADQPAPALAVIANYVFHALPQDAFRVSGGELREQRVTVISSQPRPALDADDVLDHLRLEYRSVAAAAAAYDDPDWNSLVAAYHAELSESSFSLPVAALHAVRSLRRLGGGNLVLLSGDKGYLHDHELVDRRDPELFCHGSVSLSVNYNAIARYVTAAGGTVLAARYSAALCIAAFVLDRDDAAYPRTQAAYDDAIVRASPGDFFTLRQAVRRLYSELTVAEIVAFARISCWDPSVIVDGFEVLTERLAAAPAAVRDELFWSIQQAWDNYLPIGESQDVPFFFGVLTQMLGQQAVALDFLERSLELHGPDPRTYYQMAVCHLHAGDLEAALADADRALSLAPLAVARELRERILASPGPATGASDPPAP